MTGLSDQAVARLREAVATPDLSGTRYRLVDRLGQGGMSTVFLVEDTELQRKVALKLMDVPELSIDVTDRLMREARILAQLEHPGIVPVHDVGRLADGRVFYTMKFVEGRRLDDHIENIASTGERLRLFERICETVAFAHVRGVLHRDLKPANIMVGPFGEVLVLDWGVAKFVAREDSDRYGSVVGTPGYMAPEQERGEVDKLDQRTDVYALGVILRRLISDTHNRSVPRPLKAICDMATAPIPQQRYASARDLAADVTRYLDGLSVSAHSEPWWEKAWRWLYRNRAWIMLVLAYLLARMVLLFFYRS